jgi:hypothetical protein
VTGQWRHSIIGWRAGGSGVAVAAFALRWIRNFVIRNRIFRIRSFLFFVNIRPRN